MFTLVGDDLLNDFPDTRDSLLVQVRDPANRDAWERFVQIYHPVIVRTALARGLQHADAHDLAQQVLMASLKVAPKLSQLLNCKLKREKLYRPAKTI